MILLALIFGLAFLAQADTGKRELRPGAMLSGFVTGSGSNAYVLDLDGGSAAEIVLEQGGADLSARIIAPGGPPVDVDARESGPEPILVLAETKGFYRLEVRATEYRPRPEPYRLIFRTLRPSRWDDEVRRDAQQAASSAKRLAGSGTPSNLREALSQCRRALGIWRTLGDHEEEAAALVQLGTLHHLLGMFEDAPQYYLEALPLARAAGARWTEGEGLNNLALALWQLGDFPGAIERLTEALAIWKDLKNRYGQAGALSNLGILRRETGSYEQARECYQSALQILISLGDRAHEAYVRSNLGVVLHALAQDQMALRDLNRALDLFREVHNRGAEGRTLLHIARIFATAKDPVKARMYVERAVVLIQAAKDRRSEADAWNLLGEIVADSRESAAALAHYEKALAVYRSVSNRAGEASALHNMGVLYHRRSQAATACHFLDEALALRRSLGIRDGEAETLFHLAAAERDMGQVDDARKHIETALDLTESLRALVAGPQLRMSYLALKQEYFAFAAKLYLGLDRTHPGQGFAELSLEVAERARARTLLDLIGESREQTSRTIGPNLADRERRLREELSFWSARLLDLAGRDSSLEQQAAASKMETLLGDYREIESEIQATDPQYALLKPRPLKAAEIQREVLDSGTLLLEYSLDHESSILWAVTRNSLAAFEIPSSEIIESAAGKLYSLLSARKDGSEDPAAASARRQAAGQLGRMLLSPVAALLRGKRLLIAADGALQQVPFAVVADPSTGAPLLADHEIVYLPSASVLAEQRRALAARKPPPNAVAAIADPVFDAGDQRTARPAPGVLPSFARLPHTRQEAEVILGLAPPGQTLRAMDFDADRALFTSSRLATYRFLHIATHAVIETKRPELSALVFSMTDRRGAPRDGFLRLYDIAQLHLPIELVTLSACGTGLGTRVRGEGVVGLARGFLNSGAATVVVSLWDVEDESTAELMELFYKALLKDHLRPAAALRQAQIAMSLKRRWSPYHWSGWSVIGEWR